MSSAREYFTYYKNKLDRFKDNEETILETIQKLGKPSVTAEILQETGIFKSLHKLTKRKGKVADSALQLFSKWKLLMSIAMKEKQALKKSSPTVEAKHMLPGNNLDSSSKPRPISIRTREAVPENISQLPDRGQSSRSDHYPTQDNHAPHHSRESNALDSNTPRHSRGSNALDKHASRHGKESNALDKHVPHQSRESNALDHHALRHGRESNALDNHAPYPSRGSNALDNHAPHRSRGSNALDNHVYHHGRESNAERGYNAPHHSKESNAMDNHAPHHSREGNALDNHAPHHSRESNALDNHAPRHGRESNALDNHASRHSRESNAERGYNSHSAAGNRNASYRSSDSDTERASRVNPSRKDGSASGDETNPYDNLSHRSSREHNSSKHASSFREHFASELLGSNSGPSHTGRTSDSERSSKHSSLHRDNFAPDPDTNPSSSGSSGHNGISCSQESNNLDIDSLNNPNLNIDLPQTLCCSDVEQSPTKSSRILEPYYIEMKEGMFKAVRIPSGPFSRGVDEFMQGAMMMKGNQSSRRGRDRYDRYEEIENGVDIPNTSPRDNWGGHERLQGEPTTNGLGEPKPSKDRPGKSNSVGNSSSRDDMKRKSDSPCSNGRDKKPRLDASHDGKTSNKNDRPDSTPEHKLKIKKDERSPSQAHRPPLNMQAHQSNCDRSRNSKIKDSPEATMDFIATKKERRSIYSGKKCAQECPTLRSICQRYVRKNLDCLRGQVMVPFEGLRPILETLTPMQLSKVEEYNEYLSKDTNELWKQHCNREYRNAGALKNADRINWKEEYNRAYDQQQKRLKNLTASINASASKAKPDRQTKLAYVDSQHDPLRKRMKAAEVQVVSLKPAIPSGSRSLSPAVVPRSLSPATGSKSGSSPNPKPSYAPKTVIPSTAKPKEARHSVPHKPVKKVVAPLMSKVKKSMGIVYRQTK